MGFNTLKHYKVHIEIIAVKVFNSVIHYLFCKEYNEFLRVKIMIAANLLWNKKIVTKLNGQHSTLKLTKELTDLNQQRGHSPESMGHGDVFSLAIVHTALNIDL